MNCGKCFYLEYVDGVGFCNYLEDDVVLDDLCEHFMNYEDTNNLIMNIYSIFKDNCGDCDSLICSYNEFVSKFGNLL